MVLSYFRREPSAIDLKGSDPRRRGHAPTRALTQATGVPPRLLRLISEVVCHSRSSELARRLPTLAISQESKARPRSIIVHDAGAGTAAPAYTLGANRRADVLQRRSIGNTIRAHCVACRRQNAMLRELGTESTTLMSHP